MLDHMDTTAKDHPQEHALRQEWAKAAVNLVSAYGNAHDISAARALLATIVDQDWLLSDESIEILTKTMEIKVHLELLAGDLSAALQAVEFLLHLIAQCPEEHAAPIVQEFGQSLFNCCQYGYDHGQEDLVDQTLATYEQDQGLAQLVHNIRDNLDRP